MTGSSTVDNPASNRAKLCDQGRDKGINLVDMPYRGAVSSRLYAAIGIVVSDTQTGLCL